MGLPEILKLVIFTIINGYSEHDIREVVQAVCIQIMHDIIDAWKVASVAAECAVVGKSRRRELTYLVTSLRLEWRCARLRLVCRSCTLHSSHFDSGIKVSWTI